MKRTAKALKTVINEPENWLIIGAGASFGARPGLSKSKRPVLGQDLLGYLQEWRDANPEWVSRRLPSGTVEKFRQSRRRGDTPWETLDVFFRDAESGASRGATPFERAMNALVVSEEYRLFTVPLVNSLLAHALLHGALCRFAEQPDCYDEYLLAHSNPRHDCQTSRLRVISFNYDVLFEEAAMRCRGVDGIIDAVDYAGLAGPFVVNVDSTRVPIYKPHGSVNWFNAWSFAGSAGNRPVEELSASGLGMNGRDTYVPPGKRSNLPGHLEGSQQLAIAQYCFGKPIAANEYAVEAVRSHCLEALSSTHPESSVTIIGLALPSEDAGDDPFLGKLFDVLSTRRGQKTYVNPCPDSCIEARQRYGLVSRQESFDQFLASL